MGAGPFSIGAIVLGGGALILTGILLVGFLLPTEWQAEASAELDASPEAVFAYLDSPEGWQAWTPWPDSGVVRIGPERGRGSGLTWDDPELGSGRFEIVSVQPMARVAYAVEVNDGAMTTTGSFELRPSGTGSAATWRESGDLGRNPLMGFWAFFMTDAQASEMEKGLARLDSLAGG